jgi:hypothetical protein
VPRPDGKADFLGLKFLDEPAAVQSNAGLLALQLRQLGRAAAGAAPDVVGSLEHTGDQSRRAKAIDAWVASVAGEARAAPARGGRPPSREADGAARAPSQPLPPAPPRCPRHPQEVPARQRRLHHPAAEH